MSAPNLEELQQASHEVSNYLLNWSAGDNIGYIWLLFSDKTTHVIDSIQPESFQIMSDMLRNEKPIFCNILNNYLWTMAEPVGDGEGYTLSNL